jgi:hypothetical protein
LLEKQEDILYEEHDKFINAEKCLAIEIKKNELLSSELSSCRDSISSIKNLCHIQFWKVNECEPCTCQDQKLTYTTIT